MAHSCHMNTNKEHKYKKEFLTNKKELFTNKKELLTNKKELLTNKKRNVELKGEHK